MPKGYSRRSFLQLSAAGLSAAAATPALAQDEKKGPPTQFQLACMTLPFGWFLFGDALKAIKGAGYKYVALGTSHPKEKGGKRRAILAHDATPEQAKVVGKQCRDAGLEPLMMFSMIYPEKPNGLEVLTNRLRQAAAAGIPQVLTFGHTKGGNRRLWIERFSKLGPIARDLGVLLVVKQHGGSTGTGSACADITIEVNDPGVKVNYDAGNVLDYLNEDPIPDIKKCAKEVRSFCIKDHRNWPKDQDCGPGYGEIDHYKLLYPVAFAGLKMPLCFENIFQPVVSRPGNLEGVQWLARRAREYVDVVIRGLQA